MTIDTYGLSSEQYKEFFEDNLFFGIQLYKTTLDLLSAEGIGNVDFKTVRELYTDVIYATNESCREYQKTNDPSALGGDLFFTKQEMFDKIAEVEQKMTILTEQVIKAIGPDPNQLD